MVLEKQMRLQVCYYSEIGKKLAEKISEKGDSVDPVVNIKHRIHSNCFLFPTTHREIKSLVKNLKAKNSKGYDTSFMDSFH